MFGRSLALTFSRRSISSLDIVTGGKWMVLWYGIVFDELGEDVVEPKTVIRD